MFPTTHLTRTEAGLPSTTAHVLNISVLAFTETERGNPRRTASVFLSEVLVAIGAVEKPRQTPEELDWSVRQWECSL
jgi:hypothetical protein